MKSKKQVASALSSIRGTGEMLELAIGRLESICGTLIKVKARQRKERFRLSKKLPTWQIMCPNGHVRSLREMIKGKMSKSGEDHYCMERWIECPECHEENHVVASFMAHLHLPPEADAVFKRSEVT